MHANVQTQIFIHTGTMRFSGELDWIYTRVLETAQHSPLPSPWGFDLSLLKCAEGVGVGKGVGVCVLMDVRGGDSVFEGVGICVVVRVCGGGGVGVGEGVGVCVVVRVGGGGGVGVGICVDVDVELSCDDT